MEQWNMTVVFAGAGALIIILISLAIFNLARRYKKTGMDDMEGHEFELFCANLLRKEGFLDVEVTKASKDYGVDILAEKDGITYAFQCKCYSDPVGIKAIQEIYAGRDYYERMIGVVITNQYFTQPAVQVAQKLKILLWDRGYLEHIVDEEM